MLFRSDRSKNHINRRELEENFKSFFEQLTGNVKLLKEEYLICLGCDNYLNNRDTRKLNYIKCKQCGFVVDMSHPEIIKFYNSDERYSSIPYEEWGMDNVAYQDGE